MQSLIYEEIERIANKIKNINGVISVLLFGSYSRGDFDEGSDIDLLVVFKDKQKLNANLKKIYQTTAKTDMFFQVTALTLHELKHSPLLAPALREGKVYYGNEPLKKLLTTRQKPYALITYTTANLSPKERTIVAQKLQGRAYHKYRYNGLVQKLNGYKVGKAVVMIPLDKIKTLTKYLDGKDIQYTTRHVWLETQD